MQDIAIHSIQQALLQGDLTPTYPLWEHLRPIWKRWQNNTHLPGLDAEDLQQQSYIILLESIPKYRTDTSLSFYGYYKIRLHIWRARIAKKYTPYSASHPDMAQTMLELPSAQDLAQEIEDKLLAEHIYEAIQELPEISRTLLDLSLLQHKSTAQIAQTLGLTPATIRKRKERSLTKLKKPLTSLYD